MEPVKQKTAKKRTKLRGKTRILASKYIAEEMRTKQYPHRQVIAIGISRARVETKQTRTLTRLKNMLKKYQ